MQTLQGLGQALAGFYNTGVFAAMPGLFGEIANGIGAAWKALENFGAGGQRGAALIQPYLQNLWEIIEANPELEAFDDQTRALLAFATANNLVGPQFRDAAEKMQTALERLIEKLDLFIQRMGEAAGLTFPNPGTPPNNNQGGGDQGGGGNDQGGGSNTNDGGNYGGSYASGTGGVRDFGRESVVRLHGREAVLTEEEYNRLKAQAERGAFFGMGRIKTEEERERERQELMRLTGWNGKPTGASKVRVDDPSPSRITYPEDPRRHEPRTLPGSPKDWGFVPDARHGRIGVHTSSAFGGRTTITVITQLDGREVARSVNRYQGDERRIVGAA